MFLKKVGETLWDAQFLNVTTCHCIVSDESDFGCNGRGGNKLLEAIAISLILLNIFLI